jgi:hypothetical protein
MNQQNIKQLVEQAAVDVNGRKKLACAKAFELGAAYSVSLKEIGGACNDAGIKICNCQLGCFK